MEQNDQGLLRPDLWGMLLPAIKAARAAGRAYAAGNHYVPRQPAVKYKQNAAGWPQTTKDTSGLAAESDLIDWSSLKERGRVKSLAQGVCDRFQVDFRIGVGMYR